MWLEGFAEAILVYMDLEGSSRMGGDGAWFIGAVEDIFACIGGGLEVERGHGDSGGSGGVSSLVG